MSRKRWIDGKNVHWMVCGPQSVWVTTSSFTKRGAIQEWERQQPDGGKPWRYWYRNGFRVRRVRLKFQYQ